MFHDSTPRYLGPLVADLPGWRALRSAGTSRLVAPPIKLSTVGSRAFLVAAAQVWNGLLEAVDSSSSLQTFRRQLKTHLFQIPNPHLIFWPFDWHRYSGPYNNVRYLGHSNNLCLLLLYLLLVLKLETWNDLETRKDRYFALSPKSVVSGPIEVSSVCDKNVTQRI